MAVLYWTPCYNEAHYNEVGLYFFEARAFCSNVSMPFTHLLFEAAQWYMYMYKRLKG